MVSAHGVRTWLVLLVVACIVPAAAAASVALWSAYAQMREVLIAQAQADARAIAHSLDAVISAGSAPAAQREWASSVSPIGLQSDRLAQTLARQRPSPDWIVAVFDGNGTVVARMPDAGRHAGRRGDAALVAAMASAPEGVVEAGTVDGKPAFAAFSRSALSRWTVAVLVPRQVLLAQLQTGVAWLVATTLALLALGVLMARIAAGRIAGAIDALSGPALALGRGEPVERRRLPIREAQAVADAMAAASQLLRSRTRERDAAAHARLAIEQRARTLAYAASHDALTGLTNRARFVFELERCIAAHERDGGVLTVLFLDIDDFKPVNDRHGHRVGDELLRSFASRLKAGVRDCDVVARLGGDEFAVLIDGRVPQQLIGTVNALVDQLSGPYAIGEIVVRVSSCIGAAAYPAHGRSGQALIDAADAAMYAAKAAGKRGFAISQF